MKPFYTFLSFLLLLIFCTTAKGTNVIVQKVQIEQTNEHVKAVGNAEAFRSVILYPAVGDKVAEVYFKPGDKVNEGEVLIELDSRRQKSALQEADITLNDTLRTYKRLLESHQKGAIAQSVLDDAKTQYELAKVAFTNAQIDLEDRQVRAPFSGVMGLTDVEKGDRITTQTAIASIDDTQNLYINFNAPESAIHMLKNEGTVIVSPWQGEQHILAKVAYLDSRIDPQTRTLRVKAWLNNAQQAFMPGMSFRVDINKLGQFYAVVPEAALMWGATGPYVWKSVNNKAVRVDVNIMQRLAGRLLIEGDLSHNELLVVEGVQRLRAGQALSFSIPLKSESE